MYIFGPWIKYWRFPMSILTTAAVRCREITYVVLGESPLSSTIARDKTGGKLDFKPTQKQTPVARRAFSSEPFPPF